MGGGVLRLGNSGLGKAVSGGAGLLRSVTDKQSRQRTLPSQTEPPLIFRKALIPIARPKIHSDIAGGTIEPPQTGRSQKDLKRERDPGSVALRSVP